jgi:hypothetical protein
MSSGQDPNHDGEQVEIRLRGTPHACSTIAQRLAEVLDVPRTSHPYPDRDGSDRVRIYLHATVPQRRGAP